MLAITNNQQKVLKSYYDLRKDTQSIKKQSELIADYAYNILELTANHPGYHTHNEYITSTLKQEEYMLSLKKRYIETEDDIKDQQELCHCCQIHHCNDFCMRHKRSNKKNNQRYCRCGAGSETIEGKCDTPGFDLQTNDIIEYDQRGFKVLKLKREVSRKFHQSSMIQLQSWRANCDIKVLLYQTDPNYPNLYEISNVSDYIVAYTCKGHQTIHEEKEIIAKSINEVICVCIEGKKELEYACKFALNTLSSTRVIGQAETQHSCLNLPLTLCSENMVEIRISGWCRLRMNKKDNFSSNDFFTKYAYRTSNFDMSLWTYFHYLNKSKDDEKTKIPYASGLNCSPVYPPTAQYARGALLKHFPWTHDTILNLSCDTYVLQQFRVFLNSTICPQILINEFRQVYFQHLKHIKEPTNKTIQSSFFF